MQKQRVMFHGIGDMGLVAARHVFNAHRYCALPYAYDASPNRKVTTSDGFQTFAIINNDPNYAEIPELIKEYGKFTLVDFATSQKDPMTGSLVDPELPERFVEMCCRYGLNFVRGSTQAEQKPGELEKKIKNSGINAVIAPNMAPPIVAFQNMMENYAYANKDSLLGCTLDIVESHQKGKKDTSGTARAMIEKPNGTKGFFNILGMPYKESDIIMIREPEEQRRLGVPEEFFRGHGWHTYVVLGKSKGIDRFAETMMDFLGLDSAKVFSQYGARGGTSKFDYIRTEGLMPDIRFIEEKIERKIADEEHHIRFSDDVGFAVLYKRCETCVIIHNVNGREVYGTGVVNALDFLAEETSKRQKGRVYNMIEVLGLKRLEEPRPFMEYVKK